MNILIVNGPNLNLLGEREPDVYGNETLEDINQWLLACAMPEQCDLKFFQSNHEGALIDFMQEQRHWAQAMIINAGAYTHYSYAIRDAISGCQIPTIEVHLSDIHKREAFRAQSVISQVCIAQICGHGKLGYKMALERFLERRCD